MKMVAISNLSRALSPFPSISTLLEVGDLSLLCKARVHLQLNEPQSATAVAHSGQISQMSWGLLWYHAPETLGVIIGAPCSISHYYWCVVCCVQLLLPYVGTSPALVFAAGSTRPFAVKLGPPWSSDHIPSRIRPSQRLPGLSLTPRPRTRCSP